VEREFDSHLHFSGALPMQFLMATAKEHHEELWLEALDRLSVSDEWQTISLIEAPEDTSTAASIIYIRNHASYFENYRRIQALTRRLDESYLYRYGCAALLNNSGLGGARRATIIAGFKKTPEHTIARLSSMIEGINDAESCAGQIRLTLIRNALGTFDNCSLDQASETLNFILQKKPEFIKYLEGFDVCGVENPRKVEPTLQAIAMFSSFKKATNRAMTIAVHAGEDLCRYSAIDHLQSMHRIVLSGVDTIGHGSALWLGMLHRSALSNENIKSLDEVVELMVSRKINVEICPSSNRYLTPLGFLPDIPVKLMIDKGLNVRIGTDSPTILNTTLSDEWKGWPLA
jgi:hypothetical protein